MDAFCRSLCKVELHAHLNGSVRDSTLAQFIREQELLRGHSVSEAQMPDKRGTRSFEDCFRIFALIHKAVVTEDRVRRIVREMIEDYVAENVVYLEIRTTPRQLEDHQEKSSYVDIVIDEIEKTEKLYDGKIDVRLLLSINRKYSVEEAVSTLDIAIKYSSDEFLKGQKRRIVGLDFSGNPDSQSFKVFVEVFEKARQVGLKTAVHFAEEFDEDDSRAILDFKPDRLGHACCVDVTNQELFFKLQIPLEVCPTSNLMTRSEITSYANHPVKELLEFKYPFCINTDDRGVFNVTLSEEVSHVATAFDLSMDRVKQMMEESVDYCFIDEEEKNVLRDKIRMHNSQLC